MRDAGAGGFALIGQSSRSAGTAYAGSSALAGGPDTVWYNPSGMAFLNGTIVSTSADFIFPSSPYTDQGSTDVLGGPRIGRNEDGGNFGVVPSSYLVLPLGDDFRLGFALNSPYGQSTEYGKGFNGRYEALKSQLMVADGSVALSARLGEHFAVGGGIDLIYADAELGNAIDFGAVCLGVVGPDCFGYGLGPQQADGDVRLSGDGWGVGFNLGAMAEFERGRIGVAVRVPPSITLSGKAKFRVPDEAAFLTAGGAFTNTGVKTELKLPMSVSLGGAFFATDRLTLLGQVIWTDWSRFDKAPVNFSNPAQPDTVITSDYDDSFYVSVGASYEVSDLLTVRGGLAYDQTPLSNRYRDPRLPGESTYSVALGLGLALTENLQADIAYQHFFFRDAEVDLTSPASGNLRGKFENSSDVVSLQLSYRF